MRAIARSRLWFDHRGLVDAQRIDAALHAQALRHPRRAAVSRHLQVSLEGMGITHVDEQLRFGIALQHALHEVVCLRLLARLDAIHHVARFGHGVVFLFIRDRTVSRAQRLPDEVAEQRFIGVIAVDHRRVSAARERVDVRRERFHRQVREALLAQFERQAHPEGAMARNVVRLVEDDDLPALRGTNDRVDRGLRRKSFERG